jgi:hypothetical protein
MKYLVFFITLLIIILPTAALAQGFTTATPFSGTASGDLIDAITTIVNTLLSLVAIAAVIVIIFGTVSAASAGDQEDIALRAKNNIIYALLGLIIVALSAVIVNFIIVPL